MSASLTHLDPTPAGPVARRWRAGRVLPRRLHPGAWWLWALGLAVAASRTTNPLLLGLVLAVSGYVVAARRSTAPWARAYPAFLAMGLAVIGIRVLVAALFGAPVPGTVLFRLPEIALPTWAAGVRIGGPVTAETVVAAAYQGLQLATLLACFGAANALANPRRLLRLLPGALYEVGVAAVVAISFSPQLVASVGRVRTAQRLRRPDPAGGRLLTLRRARGLRRLAMPVLEDALDRSLALAAAMDSRGYGRRGPVSPGQARLTAGLTLGGLLGVCWGLYGLLGSGEPGWLAGGLLGTGLGLAGAGLLLGGRRSARSRYRPDPWRLAESVTAASGLLAALGLVLAGTLAPAALTPVTAPLAAPTLPVLPALAVLLALVPAWASPTPPDAHRPEVTS